MIEARGRNGWFNVAGFAASYHDQDKVAWVELLSKRTCLLPPIWIKGPPHEVLAVLRKMISEIESGMPRPEKPEPEVTVHIWNGILNEVKVQGLAGRVKVVVKDEDTEGVHDEPVTISEFVFVDGKDVNGG